MNGELYRCIDAEHALFVGGVNPDSRLFRCVYGTVQVWFVLAATRVTNLSDQFGLPVEFLNPQIKLPILFGELIRICPEVPDRHCHDIPNLRL